MATVFEHKQSIGLSGIQNARELGGYRTEDGRTVKRGVLLRTARLSQGTEDDFRRLREVYHLAKIIDLRSDEEISGSPQMALFTGKYASDPDPVIEDAEYINLPVVDLKKMMDFAPEQFPDGVIPKATDLIQMLTISIEAGFISDELYFGFLDEELGRSSYSRFFRELITLDEGRSILFHCTQGKDRTGVAAMLILSALGVPEDVIIEDYMLTNTFNEVQIEKELMMLRNSGRVPPDKIDTYLMAMDGVNKKTMTNVTDHVKKNYGSVKNYIIEELGLSEKDITMLRSRFLTEE